MAEIRIIYAEPPELIVFSIKPHNSFYTLKHKSTAIEKSDILLDSDGNNMNVANIDEWVRLHTSNNHSVTTLSDLAEAFKDGYSKAYGIEDILDCGQIVFHIIKDLLYYGGYASKYADVFDIESIPASLLRERLRDEVRNSHENISPKRVARFINVCLHNGLNDTVSILEKILDKLHADGHIEHVDSSAYDNEIKQAIRNRLLKVFTKHEQENKA